jgi:D-alanyl-lipoteichoic acid acyltransferase DltB (MBOAT superfamily)
MLFNSIEFAIFLPIIFLLYWFPLKNQSKGQNFLLLVASYIFYGWWDTRFLGLIAVSSVLDYFIGIKIHQAERATKRNFFLSISILINLGFLGFFKYYNFFAASFADAFTLLGQPLDVDRLNIVLPVGISFYTFQTLSYSIDIYRKKLLPSKDFISFAAFVSFFPQLVAGPIERATNLLPQFNKQRTFDYDNAVDGLRQILWGLFKKVVIADNCAIYANQIFNNYLDYSGSTLVLGAIFFAFQIYGDFSGYSDMAIGTARLFGFKLMRNFAFPYFSRDIAEFWRRWHISLSTWFRDYVYIPLGGSKGGTSSKIRNTFIIFLISGFWHGANWTFIVWGFLNACYFLPLMLLNRNRNNTNIVAEGQWLPNPLEIFQILTTFSLTCVAWVFFRADSIPRAMVYIKRFFTLELFTVPKVFPLDVLYLILFFVIIEWLGREKEHPLEFTPSMNTTISLRWTIYLTLLLMILYFGALKQEFIYFQF